jgi:hypothetical protein
MATLQIQEGCFTQTVQCVKADFPHVPMRCSLSKRAAHLSAKRSKFRKTPIPTRFFPEPGNGCTVK